MTKNIFRKTQQPDKPKHNKYEKYGFSQNPFPQKPSVTIGSNDYRENGSIYLQDMRVEEQEKFERLIVSSSGSFQAKSLIFLMDYATRRGRGIGKTAFLHHQCSRVMADFGENLSNGNEVLFASYILPLPEGKSRRFSQFSKTISYALNSQNIIASAMWRIRAFVNVIPESLFDEITENPAETIGNNKWLQAKGVDVTWGLSRKVKEYLVDNGVNVEMVDQLVNYGHLSEQFEHNYLDNLSDFHWRKDNGKILFDEFVKLFKIAGFTNGILLIDEVEKIVTLQNTQERRSFTDSLRYFFFDGQCINTKYSFFRTLLTIHPYVQELLDPHWKATGLDRFAPLSGDLTKEYTIYFEPLNQIHAVPLAKAYLSASRLDIKDKERLEPFEKDAIEEALVISGRVPGIFLTILNSAVEKGLRSSLDKIDVSMIKEVAQARTPKEPSASDMIGTLQKPKVDLKGK